MKNNVIFSMGIFHTANGLKVLGQAKINVRQMSRGDSLGCVIFKILWDNGAKTQPRQNTEYDSSVWDPQIILLQDELEKVQKRAARFVTGNYVD